MDKPLHELLKEQIQAKGMTVAKIRELTGIAERYVIAFLEGRYDKLPPPPYARGYIVKLASVLGLNTEELWKLYKEEKDVKRSGPKDLLPTNRFALKKMNKKWLAVSTIIVLIAVYGVINFNRFLGKPTLIIMSPTSETLVTTANSVSLLGKISPNGKLTIDGKEILSDSEGNFREEYFLEPGLNRIEFSVKGLLSSEVKTTRQVIYEPELETN